MSVWVGISPLIGAGSLEGFAVGATLSGALFLAITAPRLVRRRQAAAVGTRGVPASASCVETSSTQAGAFDAGLCGVEAFGAEAERMAHRGAQDEAERSAQPQPGAQDDQPRPGAQDDQPRPGAQDDQPQPAAQDDASWTLPTGRDGRDGAYRSRHRLGDPIPGPSAGDGAPVGRTRRGGAFQPSAFQPSAFPGWASRDDQPDTPFPDVAFSDVAFPDGTFKSSRRPEVRRLPRHAAPAVSFGTKVSGRVTGLFAARPLAGGASN
jgi:hypothetical protein